MIVLEFPLVFSLLFIQVYYRGNPGVLSALEFEPEIPLDFNGVSSYVSQSSCLKKAQYPIGRASSVGLLR